MSKVSFGVLLLILLPLQRVTAQRTLDPETHRLLSTGIDLTFQQRYDSADSVFKLLARTFPDHPVGYLYQAGVLETRAMDYEEEIPKASFDSLISIALHKSEILVQKQSGSPWGHYFLGTALGYESYASAYRGEWFGGVKKAISSASEFRKVVELDSLFYDAYAGVGTYLYWKSRKTEFLHWLPFINDDRKEGLNLLKLCAEKGTYNRFTAISALISIYLDAENYSSAAEYARFGLAQYPRNRLLLWGLATALDRSGKQKEGIQAYDSLLRVIQSDTRDNLYNEIVCRLNLVKLKLAVNDTTNVSLHLKAILALQKHSFSERLKDRIGQKFEDARRIEQQFAHGNSH